MRRYLLSAVALATLLSCGRPPKPSIDLIYQGLSENLPRLRPTILAGRKILIDPGHGGQFAGTQGQGGLAEAEVNLGVSLYLWGLLREAGAEVHVTRSAERDFLTEIDSTVAGDLRARVQLVDSLEPDVFVSIHHNAEPARDPSENAVETYYRIGDPASRDLAFAVHRHLIRNLGIKKGEVRPGNYLVLRSVEVPAILGEASYLTHPAVEEHLKLSKKQRLEAEAYFLGILEYFSRGTPKLRLVTPQDSVVYAVPTIAFETDDTGGLGVDPASVEMTVNGGKAPAFVDARGRTIEYRLPWNAPNGGYDVACGVRNLLGNSSPIHRVRFRIEHPPESVTFESPPPTLPKAGGTVRVRARILDRRGLDVADGTLVGIETSAGTAPDRAASVNGFLVFPVTVPARLADLQVSLRAGQKTFRLKIPASTAPGPALGKVVIADSRSRKPVPNASVLYGDSLGDSLLDDGTGAGLYFVQIPDSPAAQFRVTARGYRPVRIQVPPADTVFLDPWFDGILLGRRFMLHPEGGAGPGRGMGALGLSAPHVNLFVARYLAGFLQEAGAEIKLTRTAEDTPSPQDVVAMTNRFRADRFIEIRHRSIAPDSGRAVGAFHFPGSAAGFAFAENIQAAAARVVGVRAERPRELVTFELQQTACPAVVIDGPSIAILDEELRLSEPWYQRRKAYGMFLGVLAAFGSADTATVRVRVAAESNASNWLVTVDGTWSLLTSPEGEATFSGLRPGPHAFELRRGPIFGSYTIEIAGVGHEEIVLNPLAPERVP